MNLNTHDDVMELLAADHFPFSSMQLNPPLPVPAATVTRSQTPYDGPDLVTALPAEILQRIASNLDAASIKALRLANKAAAVKCEFDLRASRHIATVEMTKDGIRRGLHKLQSQYVKTSIEQVVLKTSSTEHGILQDGDDDDVKALSDHVSYATTIALEGITCQSTTHIICDTFAAAPRANLTRLTISGCTLSFQVLKDILNAHRQTLRYLGLKDISLTDSPFTYEFLTELSTNFGFTQLALDQMHAPSGKPFQTFFPVEGIGESKGRRWPKRGFPGLQSYWLEAYDAYFEGPVGVEEGLAFVEYSKIRSGQ